MSCNVCVEKFNRSNRAPVECNVCQFVSCKACCEVFLMSSNGVACCMNCKSEWNRDFLCKNFTQKFIKTKYQKHQVEFLWQREQALLSVTQAVLQEERERERLTKMIYDLHLQLQNLDTKKTFIKKCPGENCRGYLDSNFKCGMCNIICCHECHEIKNNDNHVCKPEDIETARLITNDTRSCPSCAVAIFKTEGCDQMYCTQCNTAFSWNTGRIESGVIHNPHYIAQIENRNLLDVRCGREITYHIVLQLHHTSSERMTRIARFVNLIRRRELPKYVDTTTDNSDLRRKYLEKQIDEERFKQILQKRAKETETKHEIGQVIQMYTECATEIIYRFLHATANQTNVFHFINQENPIEHFYLKEIDELIKYTNQVFTEITKSYKIRNYNIDENGMLLRRTHTINA